jgi:hypothetical protein
VGGWLSFGVLRWRVEGGGFLEMLCRKDEDVMLLLGLG